MELSTNVDEISRTAVAFRHVAARRLRGTASILRDAAVAEIAAAWSQTALLPYRWRRVENQAGVIGVSPPKGEAGGLFVATDQVPRRAYMKPCKRDSNPSRARAAREKIAAD